MQYDLFGNKQRNPNTVKNRKAMTGEARGSVTRPSKRAFMRVTQCAAVGAALFLAACSSPAEANDNYDLFTANGQSSSSQYNEDDYISGGDQEGSTGNGLDPEDDTQEVDEFGSLPAWAPERIMAERAWDIMNIEQRRNPERSYNLPVFWGIWEDALRDTGIRPVNTENGRRFFREDGSLVYGDDARNAINRIDEHELSVMNSFHPGDLIHDQLVNHFRAHQNDIGSSLRVLMPPDGPAFVFDWDDPSPEVMEQLADIVTGRNGRSGNEIGGRYQLVRATPMPGGYTVGGASIPGRPDMFRAPEADVTRELRQFASNNPEVFVQLPNGDVLWRGQVVGN